MEQLGSHWTDFYEIWYLGIFRKYVWKRFIKICQVYGLLYIKTHIHFLSYLAQFFLESEIFRTNVVEKIKTHILCSVTFFRKSCCLWDNVKILVERGRLRMVIWRMGIVWWIPKATNTHSEYVTIIAFHYNNGCKNAPRWNVIRTLPVFL